MIKYLLLIFTFIFSINFSFAQESSIKLSIDTNEIRIGEKTYFNIEITHPVSEKLNFLEPKDTINKQIEILERVNSDTAYSDDLKLKTISYTYAITSFDSGFHVIQPFSIFINTDTLESNPLLLTVNTIDVDTTSDIKDIKEIYRYPFNFWDWLEKNKYYIIGVALLVALIFLFFKYWEKITPKKTSLVEPENIIPPHIIALEKLKDIAERGLWQQGEIKTYHSEITDVLREYIKKVFNIEAPEQTSEETLSLLRLKISDDKTKQKLKQVLLLADMVKFAKEKPSSVENENSLQLATDFVNETKPVILEIDKND